VAACQDQLALICQQHSNLIRHVSTTHVEFMKTNSPLCYHSPGFPVLVAGLQSQQQYNGLEGIVIKKEGERMRVRLNSLLHNYKETGLKCENLLPLVPTAGQRQAQFCQIHDLTLECIVSSKEAFRIQLKVHGVKHINTGSMCHTFGNALLKTYKAADTGEAVTMLIKAEKIRRRFGGSGGPPVGSINSETTRIIREANEALAEFECGALSAMPCVWRPTSRHADEGQMARLFVGLQARNGTSEGASMSSEVMLRGLHEYGLKNIVAPTADEVLVELATSLRRVQLVAVIATSDNSFLP